MCKTEGIWAQIFRFSILKTIPQSDCQVKNSITATPACCYLSPTYDVRADLHSYVVQGN